MLAPPAQQNKSSNFINLEMSLRHKRRRIKKILQERANFSLASLKTKEKRGFRAKSLVPIMFFTDISSAASHFASFS